MFTDNKLADVYIKAALFGIFVLGLSMVVNIDLCLFYNYVGIPCPACGMTRAFESLIYLDLGQAFRYHPLFPLALLFPYIYLKANNKFAIATGVVFIVVWLWRLYCFFPDQSPMLPNQAAFIYRLVSLIF